MRFVLIFLASLGFLTGLEAKTYSKIVFSGLKNMDESFLQERLNFAEGEDIENYEIARQIKQFFATGYFQNIEAAEDGKTLVFSLEEQPVIDSIEFEGNKSIKSEILEQTLEDVGIRVGSLYRKSIFVLVEKQLEALYQSQGKYGTEVNLKVTKLDNDRLQIVLNIRENATLFISHVSISGNESFSRDEIIDLMESQELGFFAHLSSDQDFSPEKFRRDLERIKNFYFNQGFINYKLLNHAVIVDPQFRSLQLNMQISEGLQYKVRNLELLDPFQIIDQKTQTRLLQWPRSDKTFRLEHITSIQNSITNYLQNLGYAYASLSVDYQTDDESQEVDVVFRVVTGKRYRVRRVIFQGNFFTNLDFLFNRVVQDQHALYNESRVRMSRTRLLQTSYFKNVAVSKVPVEGQEGWLDLVFQLEEYLSLNLSLKLSYTSLGETVLGFSFAQNNFLGTGNDINLSFDFTSSSRSVVGSYFIRDFLFNDLSIEPYTIYKNADIDSDDVVNYSQNSLTFGTRLRYSLAPFHFISYDFRYKNIQTTVGASPDLEVYQYFENYNQDEDFLSANITYSFSNLDRGFLATQGFRQSLSAGYTRDLKDPRYYNLDYNFNSFIPFDEEKNFIWESKVSLNYLGELENGNVPFYLYYYAGGITSVRGYRAGSLSPESTDPNTNQASGTAIGGNLRFLSSQRLILPNFTDNSETRYFLYYDAGASINTKCIIENETCDSQVSGDKLGQSVGIGFLWYTVFGPISLSLAEPLTKDEADHEVFQFGLGYGF